MSKGWSFPAICAVFVGALAVAVSGARAETSRWQTGRGGDGRATVSLLSSNTLSTGNRSIEYHPRLTIACTARQASSWTQWVIIRDTTYGTGTIKVAVRLDGGGAKSEVWALGISNRSLSRDGGDGVARLLGARQLRLSWSVGFFSGKGEAVFQLAGVKDAVAQIARTCGIDLP
jgi:hypothetical protein